MSNSPAIVLKNRYDYINSSNPTVDINPPSTPANWLNTTTGEEFVCNDNTVDNNVWVGDQGTTIHVDEYWDNVIFLVDGKIEDLSDYGTSISNESSGITENSNLVLGDYLYFNAANRLYCTLPTAIGTDDFTIEFWSGVLGGDAYGRIVQIGENSANGGFYAVRYSTSFGILVQTYASGYSTVLGNNACTPYANMTHIAIQRKNVEEWELFKNGVLITSGTNATGTNLTQTALSIGANTSSSEETSMLLKGLRITKGVARYSDGFTPTLVYPMGG